MLESLTMAPPDAILGLTEAFKKDTNPDKVNLGVGVYKDESGKTPIFSAVSKAAQAVLDKETDKGYLPIEGSPEYGKAVQELLFGAGSEIVSSGRAATAQAPGGTGALRVGAAFLKMLRPDATLWMSDETWANHPKIFATAGLEQKSFPYYNAETKTLEFEKMIETIGQIPEGDFILLQGACHNPTGLDPTPEQWEKIAKAVSSHKLMPLIDFAYQGLAQGLEEDAAGLRIMCANGGEALVASSFSKNFGLYKERVGALTIVGGDEESAAKALSHVKAIIRANYSNPPSHGGAVAIEILSDPAMRAEWEAEVATMRERINEMRKLMVETLKAKGVEGDFSFIANQFGMFSYSGLTKEQVAALKEKYAIYIVGSGRINVAGLTPDNMDYVCGAIADVLK